MPHKKPKRATSVTRRCDKEMREEEDAATAVLVSGGVAPQRWRNTVVAVLASGRRCA
jgi:hypothetical protein